MDNKHGTSSNTSVEVASKGVSTSHVKKPDTIAIHIDDGANTTSASENHVNASVSSCASTAEYYRLTSASRSKFLGKSPSKLEFQLIRKPSMMKGGHKKKTIKTVDYTRSEPVCPCRSNHQADGYKRTDLNASWTQKLKQIFESRKSASDPTDIDPDMLFDGEKQGQEEMKKDKFKIITYNFEHGCPEYYKTFDCPPHLISDVLAEQTVHHATRFWAEMFGFINIGVTFFVTFILQLYRFILYATFRTLIVGMLQITSDYFLKPLLSVIFNGFLQPPLLFVQNIFISCGNVLQPIANCFENFLAPIGKLLRAIRFVEINHHHHRPHQKECDEKIRENHEYLV